MTPPGETVAVVVVTFNRADLLVHMLDGLAAQTRPPDLVVVVDNASTDHTAEVLAARDDLPLHVVHHTENTGGAGGFHTGVREAFDRGADRMWLMDDDVVPAPDCLEVLLRHDEACLMAVREDRHGHLVEKAAVRFDLRSPLAVRPKRDSVETAYGRRDAMPELVEIEVVAFEGFLEGRETDRSPNHVRLGGPVDSRKFLHRFRRNEGAFVHQPVSRDDLFADAEKIAGRKLAAEP